MVLGFGKMFFEEPIDEFEHFQQFLICHPFGDRCHEFIVGKLLKIVYDRVFIRFPVRPISHQALVIFYKIVCMHDDHREMLNPNSKFQAKLANKFKQYKF